jgi:flavin reductase (DIM6/NTAB) family NADH-FMN oxidoreductase RutF
LIGPVARVYLRVMTPRRIGRHLEGGPVPDGERDRREREAALREAFACWATGVTIVAVRDGDRIHGVTVSAFMPLSLEPPLVLVSLGPNASALAYLDPGTLFAVSLLAAGQRGLATRYADSFPVGPSPFPEAGPPVVEGALAALVCSVEEVRQAGDHHLVTGRVVEARTGGDDPALAYFRRAYREVAP